MSELTTRENQTQTADHGTCAKTIRFADRLFVCQASGLHTRHLFDLSDKDCELLTHAVYSPKYYRRVMAAAQEALKALADVAEYALNSEQEKEN